MSALGQFLEQEGIPTVSISLIREHTAAIDPPRALWVPFMLGRPFGVPNDAVFQRRVVLSALQLLERDSGPVLEDFPDDAPYEDLGAVEEAQNCPVSFPRKASSGALAERLQDEIAQLGAWHEVAVKRNGGRTTLGITGLSPCELGEFLSAWLSGAPKAVFRPELNLAAAVKLAADELKGYYHEAKAVQPGKQSPDDILRWFWLDTAAGETFVAVRDHAATLEDASFKGLATLSLVPRAVVPLLTK